MTGNTHVLVSHLGHCADGVRRCERALREHPDTPGTRELRLKLLLAARVLANARQALQQENA